MPLAHCRLILLFAVAKPTVVFRVMGGDVQLDDVQMTVIKPAEIKPVATKAAKKD
jgi:hypothetical protein